MSNRTGHGFRFGIAKHRAQQKLNSLLLNFEDWEPHILDRVRLAKIKNNQCHWPYGDPLDNTFAYCGRPIFAAAHTRSYCKEHYLRAINPDYLKKKGKAA